MRQFQEHIAIFGRTRNLIGILTQPIIDRGLHKPAVIILNSGVIHRVGHHRMYVVMARKLAAAGHLVLRFDFSGIGDSGSRTDSLDPIAAALADISEALDWLAQTRGASEAILVGLCSGADIALRYGHTDSRVVGLTLLDPTIPPTWHFYRHYIRRRVTNINSWQTFLRGRGRIWGDLVERLSVMCSTASSNAQYRLVDPQSRKELESLFGLSIERGLKLLAVFSGSPSEGRQAYKEQLIDAFPALSFGNVLTLYYFEGCDHTFTDAGYRDGLNGRVLTWLQETSFERGASTQHPAPELSSRAIDVASRRGT
jgi:pimeloyl-ACP methyl ester carboxylesterase